MLLLHTLDSLTVIANTPFMVGVDFDNSKVNLNSFFILLIFKEILLIKFI